MEGSEDVFGLGTVNGNGNIMRLHCIYRCNEKIHHFVWFTLVMETHKRRANFLQLGGLLLGSLVPRIDQSWTQE
jgi:hypothetical protein